MTKREEILSKYLDDDHLHESIRDAVYDAMDEYLIEFAKWLIGNSYDFSSTSIYESKELLKKFKSEKQ